MGKQNFLVYRRSLGNQKVPVEMVKFDATIFSKAIAQKRKKKRFHNVFDVRQKEICNKFLLHSNTGFSA